MSNISVEIINQLNDNYSYLIFSNTSSSCILIDPADHKKILPITYTPDFVDTQDPPRYIIECKGNPNERFPLVWKLFKRYLTINNKHADLFVPRNQKDCLEVIKQEHNRKNSCS